jgi:hypothetical protein
MQCTQLQSIKRQSAVMWQWFQFYIFVFMLGREAEKQSENPIIEFGVRTIFCSLRDRMKENTLQMKSFSFVSISCNCSSSSICVYNMGVRKIKGNHYFLVDEHNSQLNYRCYVWEKIINLTKMFKKTWFLSGSTHWCNAKYCAFMPIIRW